MAECMNESATLAAKYIENQQQRLNNCKKRYKVDYWIDRMSDKNYCMMLLLYGMNDQQICGCL